MTAQFRLRPTVLAASLFLLGACGDTTVEPNPPPAPPPAVATIRLSPDHPTVVRGQPFALTVTVLDAANRPIPGATVTWVSHRQAVATVSATGVVTGVTEGEATITAAAGAKTASVVVLVVDPPVATVELDVAALTLDEGASHQLVATARDASGAPITGRATIWTSSAPEIIAVEPLGKVTALRPGTADITARVNGRTATARITAAADYPYDLLFSRWAGTAGVSPELFLADPNDPDHATWQLGSVAVSGVEPAPSPDGTRVAFAALDPYGKTDIWVVERATGLRVQLTSGPASDHHPSWSPDGQRIVFARRPTGGASGIWVMNADGTGQADLTADHANATMTAPDWSRQRAGGDRIAYVVSSGGFGHLWTMRPDGGDKRQVTASTVVFDDEPAWSPDGTTLAFTRSGNNRSLFLVNAAGGNERLLVDLPLHQFAPAWSPDGRLIAFTSTHADGASEIYTVWTSGAARLARRTFDGTNKANPMWVTR